MPHFSVAMENSTKASLRKSGEATNNLEIVQTLASLSLSNLGRYTMPKPSVGISKQICVLCDTLSTDVPIEYQDAAKVELEQLARAIADRFPAVALLVFGNQAQGRCSLDDIYVTRAQAERPSEQYNTAVLGLFALISNIKAALTTQNR